MCEEKQETTITTKICNCCGRELPLSAFNKHKNSYMKVCKACRAKTKNKDSELSKFNPRQLIEELRARGYTGKLIYIEKHEIDLSEF